MPFITFLQALVANPQLPRLEHDEKLETRMIYVVRKIDCCSRYVWEGHLNAGCSNIFADLTRTAVKHDDDKGFSTSQFSGQQRGDATEDFERQRATPLQGTDTRKTDTRTLT